MIIGAGPAGLTAACELSKHNRSSAVPEATDTAPKAYNSEYPETGGEATEDELRTFDATQPQIPQVVVSAAGGTL